MRKRIFFIILLMALWSITPGCGSPGPGNPTPTPTPVRGVSPTATPTSRPTPTPTPTPSPTPPTGTWTGIKQLGSPFYDCAYGVTVDGSGNVYVVGSTWGGLDGNTNAGDADLFLVKYNSSGNKQWTRQLGSLGTDRVTGVAVDHSGNVYISGWTSAQLDGNINIGLWDAFLVKYDSSGTKQWTRQLGSSENDCAYGVSVDGSGNIYVVGVTMGELDGNTNAGYGDLFLVKYDSSGTRQWTRQQGSSRGDSARGVAVDSSGNVYVAGQTYGALDGNTNAGVIDLFLVKYNSSGTTQWTRQLGSSAHDECNAVAVDSSGTVYVSGQTDGGLDGNTNAGNYDMFLVKYNSSGDKQWTKQRGTSSLDYAGGVTVDSSGNVYIVGNTYGGLDGNTNAGSDDMYLIKYDSSGTYHWTRQLGSSAHDEVPGVAVDSSGNVYAAGSTEGGLDGNTNAGLFDMFVVKYNPSGVKQ